MGSKNSEFLEPWVILFCLLLAYIVFDNGIDLPIKLIDSAVVGLFCSSRMENPDANILLWRDRAKIQEIRRFMMELAK